MAKLDFSVIITSFNIESYITRAIDSALSQEGVLLEVICVDDGSSDGTWEHIKAYEDTRVRPYRLQDNGGPSVARNYGIAHATGKWIAVLDGDDAFLPGRLKRILETLHGHKYDMAIDNLTVLREADGARYPMFDAGFLARIHPLKLHQYIESNRLFASGYALGYSKPVMSSDFLKEQQISYDPEIRIGEDYCLMACALAKAARCAVIAEEGYQYTVRKGSISHRLSVSDIERMQTLDTKIWAAHTIPDDAKQAQAKREYTLRRAHAFVRLVNAIKQKNIAEILKIAITKPDCVWLLYMPIEVRIRRLVKRYIS